MSAAHANMSTCGRFAPTPSGRMHLGNVFALLMAWLAARAQGGTVILRIEDLDPRGQKPELARALIDDIRWLGLDWDGEPVYQSERLDIYNDALKSLREQSLVYPCFCTRHELHVASAPHASDGSTLYPGTCRNLTADEIAQRSASRPPAWRLHVPDAHDPAGRIEFDDVVFGRQCEVLSHDTGDFLVARSDGVFAYQLACAVDDGSMGITQVVRGRDLLSSSARQIYIQRLLGLPSPQFAHVPLLVTKDGRRLSKREKDLDLFELKKSGVSAQEVLGWLAAKLGIIEEARPASPEELLAAFSWNVVAQQQEDILVDENPFGGV